MVTDAWYAMRAFYEGGVCSEDMFRMFLPLVGSCTAWWKFLVRSTKLIDVLSFLRPVMGVQLILGQLKSPAIHILCFPFRLILLMVFRIWVSPVSSVGGR